MPSNKYWEHRFELLEDAMNNKGVQFMQDSESMYRKAIKETEKEISKWYLRFAENEGISYDRAVQMLDNKELKEFHWDVKEYIKKGKTLGISDRWKVELERASVNTHITRLQALKMQMEQQVEVLTAKKSKGIDDLMRGIYNDTFYKTAYEFQKGFGVGSNFVKLDKKVVDKVISKPWAADGSNFSERIWGSHRAQLVNKLHEGLTLNLIQGKPPDKLIKDIADTFHVDRKRAATLVYTEKAYFQSVAQRDSFKNLGIEEYEIVATLDMKTSEICQAMDGQHFKLKDFLVGSTAPPFHPRCRTATAPYFDDEFEDEVKRAARDEDGKYYTVPAKMKYDDWYKAFVEGDESILEKLKHSAKDGIISLQIDKLTPCLEDKKTGKIINTNYEPVYIDEDMAEQLNSDGWLFDWSIPPKKGYDIYKLTLEDDDIIQGLIALKNEQGFTYVDLVESNPMNIGKDGKYYGVGGHLFAIACEHSFKHDNDGYVMFIAKTKLIDHYMKALGAKQIGGQKLCIDTEAALKLVKKYIKKNK